MLASNMCIFEAPPFKAEQDFPIYLAAGYEERRTFLKESACLVETKPDVENYSQSHVKVLNKIRNDPHLNGNWKLLPKYDEDVKGTMMRILGQRAMISQGREHEISTCPDSGQDVPLLSPTYITPRKRIRVTENLTFNTLDIVPVYSDLPDEKLTSIQIPDTLLFEYTDTNVLNPCSARNIAKACIMSQKEENTIRCDCCSSNPIVPCYENENCPCYKLNQKLQGLQINSSSHPPTKFASFDPVMFSNSNSTFDRCIGFSCSEACGCKGNCTNNSLLILNKKLFPLEIYRSNENVGFGLRSSVLIPAGTAVLEFTGEIVERNQLDRDSQDYAYQLTDKDNSNWRRLLDTMKFSDDYKKFLKKLSYEEFFIDPKAKGNVGRMICHSCSPNLEIVRVYQKGLSPAHVHLVFISLLNIYPGTPLTMDYGYNYMKNHLNGKCECGSFACLNRKSSCHTNMSFGDFAAYYRKLDHQQWESWHKNICEPLSCNDDVVVLD